jgi:type II secretory pathway predicted ATPase ExeA
VALRGASPAGRAAVRPTAPERIAPDGALARLEQAVRRGSGAVIVGDAGIGKSHAARTLANKLRTRGATIEYVLATEAASTVPFGALAGLLEPTDRASPGDLLEVLRGTGKRLVARAAGGLPVVIVDDAHRLDPASAALLLQLVTRHGIKVLATVRSGTPVPDAVTSLWKDAGLIRVDLAPLSEEAAADLARHLLDGPLESGTLRWLWETSAGNRCICASSPAQAFLRADSFRSMGIGGGRRRSRLLRVCSTCSRSASSR